MLSNILCDWLGICIRLSLIGPKKDVRMEIREVLSSLNCGHSELIVRQVIVWIPGLLVEKMVWLSTRLASR